MASEKHMCLHIWVCFIMIMSDLCQHFEITYLNIKFLKTMSEYLKKITQKILCAESLLKYFSKAKILRKIVLT